MLFDLKGKRRRAVQGTYLTLAVLMGAGLVLFGIGSSTNGGLGDLFSGGGGSNKGSDIVRKRIDAAEKRLQVNPRDRASLVMLSRSHYQLASNKLDATSDRFPTDAQSDLQQAVAAWQRYLATNPKNIDLGLANVMLQAYSGLAQLSSGQASASKYWAGAAEAVEITTAAKPTVNNYLRLVQVATLAGQTNKADLAGKKAVSLAPKGQRKAVQQQVAAQKQAGSSQAGGSGAPAPTTTGP